MTEKIVKIEKSDSLKLSVIIASTAAVSKLKLCLESLLRQKKVNCIEIIVSVCCDESALHWLIEEFPNVKFTGFPSKTNLPKLWGAGLARSKGEIIAITESTNLFAEDWIEATLEAHEAPHPVIGGAVEMTKLNSWVDWAAYFCEYGQFMPPMVEGIVDELPGNNVSFKRWALDMEHEFVRSSFWKTYYCRKLQEDGHQLISAPSILVFYNKSFDLIPFLVRRFRHGRCFAAMRIKQIAWFKRAIYSLGSPLLVFIFLGRVVSNFLPKKRLLKEFMLVFPIIALAIATWVFGEFCGYVAGEGNSCSYIS